MSLRDELGRDRYVELQAAWIGRNLPPLRWPQVPEDREDVYNHAIPCGDLVDGEAW